MKHVIAVALMLALAVEAHAQRGGVGNLADETGTLRGRPGAAVVRRLRPMHRQVLLGLDVVNPKQRDQTPVRQAREPRIAVDVAARFVPGNDAPLKPCLAVLSQCTRFIQNPTGFRKPTRFHLGPVAFGGSRTPSLPVSIKAFVRWFTHLGTPLSLALG